MEGFKNIAKELREYYNENPEVPNLPKWLGIWLKALKNKIIVKKYKNDNVLIKGLIIGKRRRGYI